MDRAREGDHEDDHPAVLHAPHGEGVCGEVLRARGEEIDQLPSPPSAKARPALSLSKSPCLELLIIMLPEITVNDLAEKLKSDERFVLLDVREHVELRHAK